MKFDRLGWIVAAALAGGMVGMGFQGPSDKFGYVDVAKVFNESELAKRQYETLHTMGSVRESVFGFLQTNIHMKPEDAKRFRDLSVKEDMTEADKAAVEKLKADAQANEAAFTALQQTQNPTPAQVTQLEEENKRAELNSRTLRVWQDDFVNEMDRKRQEYHNDTMRKVRDAVVLVGKKQGYTIVFSQDTALYTGNDLTAEALSQMNATNKK